MEITLKTLTPLWTAGTVRSASLAAYTDSMSQKKQSL